MRGRSRLDGWSEVGYEGWDSGMPAVAGLAVIAYLFFGCAVTGTIAWELRRNPAVWDEWGRDRPPYWHMVIMWPAIYGALVMAAVRKFRRRR